MNPNFDRIRNGNIYGRELIDLLREPILKLFNSVSEVEISFSGGLDSTLLARVCKDYGSVLSIVVGIPDSLDIKNAREAAEELDIPLREISIDDKTVIEAARELCIISQSKDPVFISFELPLYLAMNSSSGGFIITGQGADELFGGYAKYQAIPEDEFISRRDLDIDKVMNETVPLENKIANHLKIDINRPYLTREIISFSNSLPIEILYPLDERKRVIREALNELGMTRAAELGKKAAQYGSGVSYILKRAAREKGVSVREFISILSEKGA